MTLNDLLEIKDQLDKGVIISKPQWVKVLDAAIKYTEALEKYADYGSWDANSDQMFQNWHEPDTDTPEAYHGYEIARNALYAG